MDYAKLTQEIAVDPTNVGYAALDAKAVAALLNDVTKVTVARTVINPVKAASLIRRDDWKALTDVDRQYLAALAAAGGVDLSVPGVMDDLVAIFPPGSTTGDAIAAAFVHTDSRANVLGLGEVTPVDVERARAGKW